MPSPGPIPSLTVQPPKLRSSLKRQRVCVTSLLLQRTNKQRPWRKQRLSEKSSARPRSCKKRLKLKLSSCKNAERRSLPGGGRQLRNEVKEKQRPESLQRPNLQPVKTSPRPPARRQSMPSRRLRGVRNVRGVDPAKYHIADLGDDTLCDASTCVNSGPVGCDKYWHELDVKLQRPAVQYRPVLMLPATATV
mmetsp:Transcript_28497/g.66869  ORF Transcript_28497/g.66869 Transcript_28497/m.66869 type:complete len:192 (-) Transcript_28497:44-619(-)